MTGGPALCASRFDYSDNKWRTDYMCIQPKYDRIEGTPLAFLKFLRVTLVLGFVLQLINAISVLTSGTDGYSIVYCLLNLVLTFLAVLGLGSMKWIGVLAYYGLFILTLFDGVAAMVLCTYYGEYETMWAAFRRVLTSVLVLVPVWVYFGKRRLLFEPAPKAKKLREPIQSVPCVLQEPQNENLPVEEEKGKAVQSVSVESQQTDIEPVKFCRNCGCELVPGSKFCSTCGTKVIKEW